MTLRILRRALVSLMVLAAAAELALGIGAAVPRAGSGAAGAGGATRGGGTTEILLVANTIHTDIVLPVTPEIRGRFGFLAEDGLPFDLDGVENLVIGWGGRAFYTQTPTWADLSFWPAARALTVDDSVMHVALAGPADADAPDVRCLALGRGAYEQLLAYIEASFERTGGSPTLVPGAGYTPYDRFYEARGLFNALLGCNTFTAGALRAAGVTTGFWTPLPATLFLSLDLHASTGC